MQQTEASNDIEQAFSGMNTEGLEYSLIEATLEAISTKSLTPIIKEELKLKIQTARLAAGKAELPKPVFKEPEKAMLSPEEEEKRQKRKERNRVAALKCRNKKKTEKKSLETVRDELEQVNQTLKRKVVDLEKEKEEFLLKLNKSRVDTPLFNFNGDASMNDGTVPYTDMATYLNSNVKYELNSVHNFGEEQPSTSDAHVQERVNTRSVVNETANDLDFRCWGQEMDFLADDCPIPKVVEHMTLPQDCQYFVPVPCEDEAKVPGEEDALTGATSPSLYQAYLYEW